MTQPLPADVQAALDAGRKIEAIRLLREQTGMGLAEAKAAVEAGGIVAAPKRDLHDHGLSVAASDALARGKPLEAIMLVREERGIGLKEARDIVEAARRAMPAGAISRDVVERPRRLGGCLIVLVVLALLGYAAWSFLAHSG